MKSLLQNHYTRYSSAWVIGKPYTEKKQKNPRRSGRGRMKDEKAGVESPTSAWSKIAMKYVRYPSRI